MSTHLLVTGHFNPRGGMDRANYELAWHLADRVGARVHLVGHGVDEPLASHPNVTWHRVPKPLNRIALGEPLLAAAGRRVAARLRRQEPVRVVVNGGNCAWPGAVNWVHAVHAAWENRDAHAPLPFRVRNFLNKTRARSAERRAVRVARLVVTNSHAARRQIVERLGIDPDRVRVVYLGADAQSFKPAAADQRAAARRRLGLPADRPLVAFIGALGRDRNKGFDTLFAAWELLCKDPSWDADLAVAGGGAEVDLWQRAAAGRLPGRVHMLGFTTEVPALLAAADALASPTRYEAYGLGIHEALCCGLPAVVSAGAGIAERYPDDLRGLLLPDPDDAADLAHRLRAWRERREAYAAAVEPFSRALRSRTWEDMAREFAALVEEVDGAAVESRQRGAVGTAAAAAAGTEFVS